MSKLTGTFNNINDETISVEIDINSAYNDLTMSSYGHIKDVYVEQNPLSQSNCKAKIATKTDIDNSVVLWDNTLLSTFKVGITCTFNVDESLNMENKEVDGVYITGDNTKCWTVLGTNLKDEEGNPIYAHVNIINPSAMNFILWRFKIGETEQYVNFFGETGDKNLLVSWMPYRNNDVIFSIDKTPKPLSNTKWVNSYKTTWINNYGNIQNINIVGDSPDRNQTDMIFTIDYDENKVSDAGHKSQRISSFNFNDGKSVSSTAYWHFRDYELNLRDKTRPICVLPPGVNSYTINIPESSAKSNADIDMVSRMLSYYYGDSNVNRVGALNRKFDGTISFSGEPLTIEENLENTFDSVIKTSAVIRLMTSKYLGDLLWTGDYNSKVKITGPKNINGTRQNDFILFHGYVEPNTYSQPFANYIEEIEVNLIDFITRLEDLKYNNITPDTFYEALSDTKNVTFRELLIKMVEANGFDTTSFKLYGMPKMVYDTSDEEYNWWDCAISENYLYGEDYDGTLTYGEILEEMMKYVNMHIKQIGDAWYIFDWDNLKVSDESQSNKFSMIDIVTGITAQNITIPINYLTANKSGDNDGNITVDDVYNQIKVKCKLESIDTIIESPFDSDTLSSVYSSKQLYCREYRLDHKNDWNAMIELVNNQSVEERNYTLTDWYVQLMYSKYWNFNWNGVDYVNKFLFDSDNVAYKQTKLLEDIVDNTMCPLLVNVTKVENPTDRQDNEVSYSVNRSTCLYIGVNGEATMEEDTPLVGSSYDNVRPTVSDLSSNSPIAEYISPRSGAILSPSDDATTNYIVFKGKITLMPAKRRKETYFDTGGLTWIANGDYIDFGIFKPGNMTILPSLGGNSIYTRRYFNTEYSQNSPNWELSSAPDKGYTAMTLKGMHSSSNDKDYKGQYYKYHWTRISKREGNSYDNIAKLPLLECELIVGDKRLIEYDIDENGNSKFKWVKLGEEPYVYDYSDEDASSWTSYQLKTFSLGINPAIDDYIIGTDFDIQNTVTFEMNLEDVTGTAIPIKKTDNLSGKVTFRILGVINLMYDDVIYRHRTWFRKVKYTSQVISLLKQVSSICISDFECNIQSDNAGYDSSVKEDRDLVYMTAESDISINTKDDIEFQFVTQPTSEECRMKNIKNSILQNGVVLGGKSLSKIKRGTELAKPEEMYIDSYYNEYSSPKLILEQSLKGQYVVEWSSFKFTMMDKMFYIINKSHDVLNDIYVVKMKEV